MAVKYCGAKSAVLPFLYVVKKSVELNYFSEMYLVTFHIHFQNLCEHHFYSTQDEKMGFTVDAG